MSDGRRLLCLPKRYIPKVGSDWMYDPESFQLTCLGKLCYSFVCGSVHLGFFQDNISQQVFFAEWTDAHRPVMKEEGEQWNIWYCEPEDWERIRAFIFGWGLQYYGSVTTAERDELWLAVQEALDASPSARQIDGIRRYYRFKAPFTPWWTEAAEAE